MLSRAKKCHLFRQWPMPSIINYIWIQTENDSYWQKWSFYFLQNIWKCSVFEHLHIFAKSTNLTPKYVSPNKINIEYQKTLNFMLITISLNWAWKNVLAKSWRQKLRHLYVIPALHSSMLFAYNFFRNICLNPYQRIFNWHKILRF